LTPIIHLIYVEAICLIQDYPMIKIFRQVKNIMLRYVVVLPSFLLDQRVKRPKIIRMRD